MHHSHHPVFVTLSVLIAVFGAWTALDLFRRILLAAKKFSDADKAMPLYYRTTEEMLDEFAYLGPEKAQEVVVTNTNAIADSVEVFELLPKDLYPPKIENSAQQLKDLVYGKMTAIYGETPPKLITDREEVSLGKRKYFDLNSLAMRLVEPGGLLVTCSCSGLLPPEEFLGILRAAGRNVER